jgi:hypothetical protein
MWVERGVVTGGIQIFVPGERLDLEHQPPCTRHENAQGSADGKELVFGQVVSDHEEIARQRPGNELLLPLADADPVSGRSTGGRAGRGLALYLLLRDRPHF